LLIHRHATMVGPNAASATKAAIRHFIFGYGSLICPQSRSITAPTLTGVPATPAIVYNLQRTWSARVADPKLHLEGTTAVGVRFRRGHKCSGVLIEVDEEELARFDEREQGYDRKLIGLEHVHRIPDLGFELDDEDHVVFRQSEQLRRRLSSFSSSGDNTDDTDDERNAPETSPNSAPHNDDQQQPDPFLDTTLSVATDASVRVWVYLQREHRAADRRYPIHQTYVDVIMRGCLSIGEGFARSFLDTTHGWWHHGDGGDVCRLEEEDADDETQDGEGGTLCAASDDADAAATVDDDHHTWVEDRHLPLYVRADPAYSRAFRDAIDRLVGDHHPEALERRRRLPVEGESDVRGEGKEGEESDAAQ
jgi:hypothetical protein